MKKIIMMILLVGVLAVIAFGYVSTPVPTFPPTEPNHPNVMGKKTIAEFVENEAIFNLLNALGVDYAQGYGIGKPVLLTELKLIKPFMALSK